MSDLLKSIGDWLKEKTSSPLYFTYMLFLIVWNWKIFYILFWEDSSLFRAPRIEYVPVLEFHIIWSTHPNWSIFFDWIINTGWQIIPPIVFTYFAIKYLPRLQAWAHSIHLNYFYQRKEACAIKELEYQKRQTERLKSEAKEKEIQKTQKLRIEGSLTSDEKWKKELLELSSNTKNLEAIDLAVRAAYKTGGRISRIKDNNYDPDWRTLIRPDLLSILDSWEIIQINHQEDTISLTEKGKFFIKKLQNENKIALW